MALQVEKAQSAATRIEQYVLDIEHQLELDRVSAHGQPGGDPLEQRRIEYFKLQRQVPAVTEVVVDRRRRARAAARLAPGDGCGQQPAPTCRRTRSSRERDAGRTYYGPVYFRKGTEPYMTIARPAGSGGGVTAAEVNLKFVWDVVSRIKIGEAGLAYVVDADRHA